ncbi:MAG: hypothetical protein AB7C89_00125 [Intestinibacillus sp.]
MSEEMRPQAPEEQSPAEPETEALQTVPETPASQIETSEPEAQEAPAEPKILGMPALMFRCLAIGFAVGLILTGLLRLSGSYLPVILCTGVGWLVGRELQKRQNKS